jgi:hypothetical protein
LEHKRLEGVGIPTPSASRISTSWERTEERAEKRIAAALHMRKLVFPVWLIAAGMTRIEEADAMRGLHTIFEVKMFPKATAPARGLQSQTPLTVHKRRCARACSKACACTPSTAAHAHRRENGGRARPLTGSGLGGPRVVRRLSKSALRRYAKNDAVQPPSVDDSLLRELDEREEALGGQTIWAWRLDLIRYVAHLPPSELNALRCRGCSALAPLTTTCCNCRKLLLYYVPAAMITLADATMSLVDTLCVGQFGSTIELAALGKPSACRLRRVSCRHAQRQACDQPEPAVVKHNHETARLWRSQVPTHWCSTSRATCSSLWASPPTR